MGTNSGATTDVNNKSSIDNRSTNCMTGTGLASAGNLSACMVGGNNIGVNSINLGALVGSNNNNNNNNNNHNMAGGLGGLGSGGNNNNNVVTSMAGVLGVGSGSGGASGNVGNGSNEENNGNGANINNQQITPQYTIPGILHFIQHEWSRFELERSQWDVDRAELQVSKE